MNIIPLPQSVVPGDGQLILSSAATISYAGPGARDSADLLADYLRPATGFDFPVEEGTGGTIKLQADGISEPDAAGFVDETYRLDVSKAQAHVSATSGTGLARGIQTLRQLLPPAIFSDSLQTIEWGIPAVEIQDTPRFRWRGQHLDVCRHFFSVKDVCRFIDLLALHRFNTCHLHLTEDQGWRIEIKKYPRLTEVGSTRACTLIGHHSARPRRYDNQPYGGFYTHDDIREIVTFATRRHITLVPEIDMPGHMVAAIAAYPELGNFTAKPDVRCHWGISQTVLNVEDSTVLFMKDILDEVMDLFPGRFIHIGGDEAPKIEWSESRRAQERMAELGLKSEEDLQSWFIRQIGEHIQSAGRRFIGWDEILEGGLAPGAAVMSWRGEGGGLEASAQGHDVVMATNKRLYFDYYQSHPTSEEPLAIGGMLPIDAVYAYDPVPTRMTRQQARHVLGAQGQLWTEYIPTRDRLDYMGFPRICALSEILWLEESQKNYSDFLSRLGYHRQRLSTLGVNAHPRP